MKKYRIAFSQMMEFDSKEEMEEKVSIYWGDLEAFEKDFEEQNHHQGQTVMDFRMWENENEEWKLLDTVDSRTWFVGDK